jgi:catechol 2,3-dioxygenase-like lactoylglutathione lyase family enzyme
MARAIDNPETSAELGPPRFDSFAHASLPCRDLEEGLAFYIDVLGGELRVNSPIFASFVIAEVNVGIGINNCSFIGPGAEYPHLAFYVDAAAMTHMQGWLAQCGIPTSNPWTRRGIEALMFFRDPSGNVIELLCQEGFEGADKLPRGTAAGHGIAIDIDALRYDDWKRPSIQRSREIVRD